MHNVGDNFIIQLFLMAAFCAFSEEESISGAAFLLRVGSGTQHEQLPHGRRVRHRVSIPPISIRFKSFLFLTQYQESILFALAMIHMQIVLLSQSIKFIRWTTDSLCFDCDSYVNIVVI